MSATFWKNLILDIHSGCSDSDHAFGHPGCIDGITATGIQISHDRNANCLDDIPGKIDDILHLNQADIWFGQKRAGQTEAGNLKGFKTTFLNNSGTQSIMTARDNDCPPFHNSFS